MKQDRLSSTLSALADPTRRAIVARLRLGEASVAELAEPFEVSARAISKHVRVLEQAGLVVRSRDAQRRPSRLRIEPLRELDGWLETYRRIWTRRFDRFEASLARSKPRRKS